jgi:tRNA pseudouridine65 synthase
VSPPAPSASAALDVLFADEHLVVVAKPAGLLVHNGWGRAEETVVALAHAQLGRFVYPVHRLDRGASGALALALDAATARALGQAFAAGRIEKRYLALVRGVPPAAGVIDHPIPRREGGPRVPATTAYRVLATFERYALVEAAPTTGRLHQVRRHLKHLGHPLIGDANYGKSAHTRALRERFGLARLALHAVALGLVHPATGAPIRVTAPLPEDLAAPLARMGLWPLATVADGAEPGGAGPADADAAP